MLPADAAPGEFVQVIDDVVVGHTMATRLVSELGLTNLVAETNYELVAHLDTGLVAQSIAGMTVSVSAGSTVLDIVARPSSTVSTWIAALRLPGAGLHLGGSNYVTLGDTNGDTELLVGQQLQLAHAYTGATVTAATVALAAARSDVLQFTTANRDKPAVAPAPVLVSVSGGTVFVVASSPSDTGGVSLESFTIRMVPNNSGNNTRLTNHLVRNTNLVTEVESTTGYTAVVRSDVSAVANTATVGVTAGVFIGTFSGAHTFANLPSETTFDITVEPVSQVSLCLQDVSEVVLRPYIRVATTVADVPGAVDELRRVTESGGTAELEWLTPSDLGGLPLHAFELQYASTPGVDGNLDWIDVDLTGFVTVSVLSTGHQANGVTLYGLTAGGATYQVRVRALTSDDVTFGGGNGVVLKSEWQTIDITTTDALAPLAPTDVSSPTSSITGGSFDVTWCPNIDDRGAAVTQYKVEVFASEVPVGVPAESVVVDAPQATTQSVRAGRASGDDCTVSVRISGRSHSTAHAVLVQSISSAGTSTATQTTVTTTAATPPSVPRNLAQFDVRGGAFYVSWTDPEDHGGSVISGYVVTATEVGASSALFETFVSAGATLEYLVHSLTNNRQYVVTVMARVNAAGGQAEVDGAVATATFATLSTATTPEPPFGIGSQDETGGTVGLTWSKPLDTGGLPVFTYVVAYRVLNSNATFEERSTRDVTYTMRGLSPTTDYEVRLRTKTANSNPKFESAWSSSVTVTTVFAKTSGPPTFTDCDSVFELQTPYNGTLSWEQPLDTGGGDIDIYRAYAYVAVEVVCVCVSVCLCVHARVAVPSSWCGGNIADLTRPLALKSPWTYLVMLRRP